MQQKMQTRRESREKKKKKSGLDGKRAEAESNSGAKKASGLIHIQFVIDKQI